VVYFAGHTHATPDIWNNGTYTAVGTGSLATNMMFMQVDGNGNVRIQVYPTAANVADMTAPSKVWTFSTPVAAAVAPTDSSLADVKVPSADIFNVTFADNTTKDSAKNTPVVNATAVPTIAKNDALGKSAAAFNGTDTALIYKLSSEQLSAMGEAVSMELTLRLNGKPASGETVLFGNGKYALAYTSEGKLVFRAASGSDTVSVDAADVKANQWIHVVVTCQNGDLRMYVDGLRTDKSRIKSGLDLTSAGLGLGGRADSDTAASALTAMSVSNFRVYNVALDSTQAYTLAAQALNTKLVFADDAVFRVVKGNSYVIPMPAASNANNSTLTVALSGLDKYGSALYIRDGRFTPYNTGNYTLTYRVNGLLVTKTVQVVNAGDVSATVTLDASAMSIAVGKTAALKAMVSVYGEEITWTSSNSAVATVDANGIVTGLKAGKAVITATLANGNTATCEVTVTAGEKGDSGPTTGEAVPWALAFAVLSMSLAVLVSVKRKVA
jgi:hypothetical protein